MTIPNSVTSIESGAFIYCASLTNVTIGGGVASIGDFAFESCDSLASLTIPDSVTSIGYDSFRNCYSLTNVTIGSGVTNIADGAFDHCESLTSVTIPDSVTSIGSYSFQECSGLTSITIPDSVTSIGDYAFFFCGLTSLAIPNSVTNIGREAFSQRYKYLKDITVSQYVCDVGLGRIYRNPAPNGITNLVFSDNVTSIGCEAFAGSEDLASLTIPDSVTNIGDFAFNCCASLTNVTIGGGVASIGDFAFESCDSLASLTIPDSVTNIGEYAFYECSGLTSITIPDSVTSIESGAFSHCDSLTNVTFLGNAPDVGSWLFERVASGCVAAVSPKSTGWGVSVGEDWNGLMLQCWPEVLTAAADDAEVCGIVATFADKGLASKITTVDEYEDFKAWVDEKNLYQPAVVDSLHAEAAYLLGAERLFENEPTVEIGELAIAEGESAGTTVMTVAVTVKDGENAMKCAAEKVKEMFEATGDLGDWNGAAKLTPTVTPTGTDASGKMTFVVTPGDGTAAKAFLRIKR